MRKDAVLSIFISVLLLVVLAACCWGYLTIKGSFSLFPTHMSRPASHPCATNRSSVAAPISAERLFIDVNASPVENRDASLPSNDTICSLQADTGALVSHYTLRESVFGSISSLTLANDVLYFTERAGSTQKLCAARSDDGTRLWCQAVPSGDSLLLVAQGTIYAGAVAAFNASDGKRLWSYMPDSGVSFAAQPVIAVADGLVYLNRGSASAQTPAPSAGVAQVCALQASSGKLAWCQQVATGGEVVNLAAADGAVYANVTSSGTFANTVYALRASDGKLLWRRSPACAQYTRWPFLIDTGRLYLTATDCETGGHTVYALRAADGATLWVRAGFDLAVGQGDVYMADANTVSALQASSGRVIWYYATDQAISRPVFGGGSVYAFIGSGQQIYALDAGTGVLRWAATNCSDPASWPPDGEQSASGAPTWCYWDKSDTRVVAVLPGQ